MSTIVYQSHVSCFETQHTETTTTTTTTLKLKVAAPPRPPADVKTNLELGNWGLLQTVSADYNKETSYSTKSSFSRLSPKSLQICTENLGSETGTDTITDGSSIFCSLPQFSPTDKSIENSTSSIRVINNTFSNQNTHHKSANSGGKVKSFPPPLTTMSGSSSLQVRRHREGGRLIIEAVEAPFRNSYLQAERSDGRLRLCFLTAESTSSAAVYDDVDEEGEKEEQEEGKEIGDETGGDDDFAEAEEEGESESEEFDGEINLEMGIENFQRLSRCNEGGHGHGHGHGNKELCWKPALWVATS